MRVAGFIVVSFRSAGIISPRPLKREIVDLAAFELAVEQRVLVRVVAGVDALLAGGDAIERRHREEEPAGADERGHLLVEEGDQQRGDVGAVDVGVGHDDDALVAQIVES